MSLAAGAPARLTSLVPSTLFDPDLPGLGVEGLVLTPDGRSLLSADGQGRLTVYDLSTEVLSAFPVGSPSPDPSAAPGLRHDLALSPDGRLVLLTDPVSRALRVVALSTRSVESTVALAAPPTCVVVEPDGRHAEVADIGGTVTTVDVVSGAVLGAARVASGSITALAATRDGRLVAVTADSSTLLISDLDGVTGRPGPPRAVALPHLVDPSAAATLALDPEGRRAYVVTAKLAGGPPAPGDGVTVVDVGLGAVVATVGADRAVSAAVSPDGRSLYLARTPERDTVAGPGPVLVVEARDITAGYRLLGELDDPITYEAASPIPLSPDGRRLYLNLDTSATVVDLH